MWSKPRDRKLLHDPLDIQTPSALGNIRRSVTACQMASLSVLGFDPLKSSGRTWLVPMVEGSMLQSVPLDFTPPTCVGRRR